MNEGDVTSPRWAGGANDTPAPVGGDYEALVAERDALRAQLDGHAVEKTTVPQFVRDTGANHLDLLPRPRGHFEFPLMRRLVGPWTAVEEGDDQ